MVERHDVGDGAQRDDVQVPGRHTGGTLHSLVIEPAPERRHEVERYAYAGKVAAGEAASGKVRIHDHGGIGQLAAWQVVVGNQHRYAQPVGLLHPREARNPVVDGDQKRRRTVSRNANDFRRQPIAEFEAVWHEIANIRESEFSQAAHHQRGARRAVDVEIPYHRDPGCPIRDQQVDSGIDVLQRANGGKPRQCIVQFVAIRHTAGSEEPRAYRIQIRQRVEYSRIRSATRHDGATRSHAD